MGPQRRLCSQYVRYAVTTVNRSAVLQLLVKRFESVRKNKVVGMRRFIVTSRPFIFRESQDGLSDPFEIINFLRAAHRNRHKLPTLRAHVIERDLVGF